MTDQVIIHRDPDVYKVEITKGMKDSYGWTVRVQGDNADKCMDEAVAIDKKLRGLYGDKLGGN